MSKRIAKRVLLVGWDAADWQIIKPLMDAGKMPVLQQLVDGGVMGNVSTLHPIISPILWNSIATGKRADKHGILGFVEPDGDGSIRPVSSTSRKAKAVWNILSQNGLRSCVVGWFASHPAEAINGVVVSDRYQRAGKEHSPKHLVLDQHAIHPTELFERLADLRIGVGDISAQQVIPFIPEAHRIDQAEDRRLPELCELLAECASIHNAATWLIENETWDFMAVYYDAIDHFGHGFMEYCPPKMEHVSEEDFEIYQHVVEGCYRFHDMLLGRLMQLAGPDTTVILLSDHGFHHGSLRPKPSAAEEGNAKKKVGPGANPIAWHRPQGVLAMHGPGIKRDELVHGASLLDMAPTILALLGLAIPDDMDGKPLTQTFSETVTLDRIPTYELEHPDDGVRRGEFADDPYARQLVLKSLIELGYIESPSDDKAKAVEQTMRDHKHNLAQVYFGSGRYLKAYNLLKELLAIHDNPHLRARIAMCLISLGRLDEAEEHLRGVEKADYPLATMLHGQVLMAKKQYGPALELLKKAEASNPRLPHLHVMIGQTYLRQERWERAEAAFRGALEIDEDDPEAHDGLGAALRNQGKLEDSLYEHMRSASLLHYRAQTHINLGMVLAEIKQIDWAIQAFKVAAELAPRLPFPHRCLSMLYARAKRDYETAQMHMKTALRLRRELREQGTELKPA